MYYIYLLRSLSNGRLYIGSTNDVARRFEDHNSGRSKYTRNNRPYKLLYSEEFRTRSEAVTRETFLKTGKGRELLQKLLSEHP